jgi:hypothetical protein
VYGANLLNQYDVRSVPPQVSVIGEADADATVTVNLASTVRKGEYWWGEALAANGPGPAWLAITNIAVLEDGTNPHIVATNVGRTRVAQALEEFAHDDDGNLTSDSLWVNTWNAENRRTAIQSSAAVPAAGRAQEQWTFLPDGRWIERIVSTNNGGAYYPAWTNRYVWDGNVLLAVLDRTNGVELAFARGLDLSGSLQGAGGVGGLVWVTQHSTLNSPTLNSLRLFRWQRQRHGLGGRFDRDRKRSLRIRTVRRGHPSYRPHGPQQQPPLQHPIR